MEKTNKLKYTPEEINSKLPKGICLDLLSYKGIAKKARFIDEKYGEWWALPDNVLRGQGHPMGKNSKIALSIDEVKLRLPKELKLDESTYIKTGQKARFIDEKYGEWWVKPSAVFCGTKHPLRAKAERSFTAEDVSSKLKSHIKLDKSTYQSFSKKAKFIDDEYGEWWTLPMTAIKGKGHPKRHTVERTHTPEHVQSKIPPYIRLDASTYVNTHKKARFIDDEYGSFWMTPHHVLSGYNHPNRFATSSKGEIEIINWIKSIGLEASKRRFTDKDGRIEVDIFIESKNIAIEYNGLYWHSEKKLTKKLSINKSRYYHYNKMEKCSKLGIRLITIFEDEWKDRKEQIKGFLKSILQKSENVLYARECEVKKIDTETAKMFINSYHIQKKISGSLINFGIFNDQELVGVLSANRHHRKNDNSSIVLDRMCFKSEISVIGGASKLFSSLLSYARDNQYKNIISWSDNRWSQGNVYKKIGFTFDKELKPDYSYVKNDKRYSKQSKKKTKEEKETGKTERELRMEQGYYRIWDCGKKTWIYNL